MAGDNHHRLVDDNRLAPAELVQRGCDGRDRARVAPRISVVRDELLDLKGDDVHKGLHCSADVANPIYVGTDSLVAGESVAFAALSRR